MSWEAWDSPAQQKIVSPQMPVVVPVEKHSILMRCQSVLKPSENLLRDSGNRCFLAWFSLGAVLGHLRCCNKIPHTGWLRDGRSLFLITGGRQAKVTAPADPASGESPLPAHGWPSSPSVLLGGKGREPSEASSIRALNPTPEAPPS